MNKSVSRNQILGIRTTNDFINKFDGLCERLGYNLSEVLRYCLKQFYLSQFNNPELFQKSAQGDVLMLTFKEWLNEKAKNPKKKKESKYVKSANQGSAEVRYVNQQGKVDRNPEAIEYQGIYYFPEP